MSTTSDGAEIETRSNAAQATLAAAARCFLSKTLDALDVRADASYRDLDPELRDVLVVGRPITDA